MIKKIILILLLSFFVISCSKTEEEIEKEIQFCNNLSNDTYQESLRKAISDPTVWQFGGYDSAQDYAEQRYQGMMERCLKE